MVLVITSFLHYLCPASLSTAQFPTDEKIEKYSFFSLKSS